MGGIFLCPRLPGQSLDAVEETYKRSLQVFGRKGLSLDRRIARPSFITYRFRKRYGDADQQHILEMEGDDFILASGTMLYNKKVGRPALAELFSDFSEGRNIDEKLLGNYCVVISRNSQLWVLNDYCSYYPLYVDSSGVVVSSSFLAVAKSQRSNSLNIQEYYEFLLHGFFVHDKTLLSDVHVMDSKKLWRFYPGKHGQNRPVSYKPFPKSCTFEQVAGEVEDSLCSYFDTLGRAFGGKLGSALSGGYDTRLILALIRKLGLESYLHVYGSAGSSDVVVAKTIAEGENIRLEHVDKDIFAKQNPDDFSSGMEQRLYFFDGLNPLGVIDDGRDILTRLHRAEQASLQLNGAGGEIYREIWNLSDRRIDISKFIRMRFDNGTYPFCRTPFKVSDYFSNFADKIRNKLGIERTYLERSEAELLFPLLRNLFAANNNSANNQVSYALLPFMEPLFVYSSASIPLKFKYYGQLQATLIKSIDPRIARYESSYGINFSSPIPMSYKFKVAAERYIPLSVRLLKRKMTAMNNGKWPYYLNKRYLSQILDFDNLQTAELIDISKIRDAEVFNRALSVELILDATRD